MSQSLRDACLGGFFIWKTLVNDLVFLAIQVVALLGAAGALYGAFSKMYARWGLPLRERLRRLVSSIEKIPDVVSTVESLHVRVATLHAEVRPNGGSSLRDAVDRVEQTLLFREFAQESFMSEMGVATFVTDSEGLFIKVNREFCRITVLTEEECMGDRWINAVPERERERTVSSWRLAVRDKRDWTLRNAKLQTAEGVEFPVRIFAYAVKDRNRNFVGHHGFVRRERSTDEPRTSSPK